MKLFAQLALIVISMTTFSLGMAKKTTTPRSRSELFPQPALKLASPGVKGAVPYEKYGEFQNVGSTDYKYVITDKKGLAEATGEGIFPNTSVFKDPSYVELVKQNKLNGNHWAFIDTKDTTLNFFKWASTNEEPGVKQFYTAVMLERLGLITEAVKAYYACAVHFPKSVSYTYYKTPWYIGPTALDRVEILLRRYPEVPLRLEGGKIHIEGRYDDNTKNDVFAVDPGRLLNGRKKNERVNLSKQTVVKTVGGPAVQLRQYENRHWQLFVDGKPFQLRAITYSICPVGLSPDRGTWNVSRDWQLLDSDKNGVHDGFFESYVDANLNGRRDGNEPMVGDAQLLKDMGVNTFRAYHHIYNKDLFRQLHKEFGFYVLCGDLIGMYTVGSGAKWEEGTDYSNPKQQQAMLASVRKMVEDYKDEPYILMWVLGNENVYGNQNNSPKNPEAFFEFVNRAAQLIHELDPSRPVAIANGDFLFLDVLAAKAPEIDVIGANSYRGEYGFGFHYFQAVKDLTDKPVFVSEYGTSAYADGYSQEEVEGFQAMYLANNWEDLESNMAGRGVGNALGGVLFEFTDEWWKANAELPLYVQKERAEWYAPRAALYKDLQPHRHDTVPQFGFPFLDGWSYEEWLGVVGQGDGKASPFLRVLRPSYHRMKEVWKQ